MKEIDERKKAIATIVVGIILVVLSLVLIAVTTAAKDSYEYHFNKGMQSMVNVLNIGTIALIAWGCIEIIIGIIKGVQASSESPATNNSNLVACPDCSRYVSVHARACPHCGREMQVEKEEAAESTAAPIAAYGQEKIPAWMQVEMEKNNQN